MRLRNRGKANAENRWSLEDAINGPPSRRGKLQNDSKNN